VQVLSPDDVEGTQIFAGLGLEPLGPDLSSDYLLERARSKVRPIKNFLMDAKVVVGIGNIYANEILFAAGIKPTRGAGTLGEPAWERVMHACRQVLERAIACGGTTISDYVRSSGGELCQRCRSLINRQVLAGRATYFCPQCQR
jgi:formamidopyrimidine-DNA glycosylase